MAAGMTDLIVADNEYRGDQRALGRPSQEKPEASPHVGFAQGVPTPQSTAAMINPKLYPATWIR